MPLHSCMNCTHFVAKGSVRCLVESAEEVQDPSGGNRCAHFEFANAAAPAAALEAEAVANEFANRDVDDPATARKKWAELFGD